MSKVCKSQIPTIHLNGTSRETLIDDYSKAAHAVSDAISALKGTEPNGRDYYVQREGALAKAQLEHVDRLQRLEDVHRELMQIWEGIDRQEGR